MAMAEGLLAEGLLTADWYQLVAVAMAEGLVDEAHLVEGV